MTGGAADDADAALAAVDRAAQRGDRDRLVREDAGAVLHLGRDDDRLFHAR
ncbi:MAG: hypothetical protein KF782_19710 [Labilithrix sp.]|nr:hypothetical protein [Labilithrix sp.]